MSQLAALPCSEPRCHFSTLAHETVLRILDTAIAGSPSDRIVVALVCKEWAEIVDKEAACNRGIDFAVSFWDGGPLDVMSLRRLSRRCYEATIRSRFALVDLLVSCSMGPIGWIPTTHFIREIEHELDALCHRVSHRVRSLDVRRFPEVVGVLLNHPWLSLSDLSLHVDADPSAWFLGRPPLVAPSLTRLSSNFISNAIVSVLPIGNRISTLELYTHRRPCFEEATLSVFLFVISAFPFLERLTIAVDDIIEEPPSTTASLNALYLRELNLSSSHPPFEEAWNPGWLTSTLWLYFTAPALKELRVPQRWFEMGAVYELDEFFERSGCTIYSIRFVECTRSLVDRWRVRHQSAWPTASVHVDVMAAVLTV
ncbi:hypothetical protein K438DRAFT_1962813 [Mycena galopus ATCC 62051]|nr:hypothetical protein K438DRAFT_1962813 [Mycena galopus ATCC 62051]